MAQSWVASTGVPHHRSSVAEGRAVPATGAAAAAAEAAAETKRAALPFQSATAGPEAAAEAAAGTSSCPTCGGTHPQHNIHVLIQAGMHSQVRASFQCN